MVPRGRKPKPTAVKELAGNPGKRALNKHEPKPEEGVPLCPEGMEGEARREWSRVVDELVRMGVMTTIDRAVLASYCSAYARWWNAEMKLKMMDDVITTAHGNKIQNPYVSISNRSMELMVKFAAELGMTPSSRARLVAEKPTEEDKMAGFLFGKKVKVAE